MDPSVTMGLDSSYKKNNYGDIFSSIIRGAKPRQCVELGVLHAYSTIYIARGLKQNGFGILDAYDLFEGYEYNRSNYGDVVSLINDLKIDDIVKVNKGDAFKAHENYTPGAVEFLHVDLSNTGDILKFIMEAWDPKLTRGSVIAFEGGSQERDEVDWMVRYNKSSIKHELENNEIIKEKYVFGTYLAFPSLTVLLKKR